MCVADEAVSLSTGAPSAVLPADRTSLNTADRAITENFLGKPARFSYGAFLLAALLKAPTYFVFALREKTLMLTPRYSMRVHKTDITFDCPRAEREAMAAYARELEPKAANYDRFLSGDGTYSIGAVAKILGRSQNKLFDELRNAGILIAKGAMRNTPYQKYMHHFTVRAHDYTCSDGTVGTSYTTKVQPSGLAFIQAKLGIGQGALI